MALDPTRTLSLRRRANSEINRRFKGIAVAARQTVANMFLDNPLVVNAEPADPRRFVYLYNPDKPEEFGKWLREQTDNDILTGNRGANHWLNVYVGTAYGRSAVNVAQSFTKRTPAVEGLGGLASPNSVLAHPAHRQRAQLIYNRAFSQLNGITKQMEAQMQDVISQGILRGDVPTKIAKDLTDRVNKIGITRSRLIARTEIIYAHNEAAITEGERLGNVLGVDVKLRWITTQDGRAREEHQRRNGRIISQAQARAWIGEPNCRCSVVPLSP